MLPGAAKAHKTYQSFTASGRALFMFFAGLLIVSTIGLLYILENRITVPAPARGGSLSEGIIGAPRFINPVLALSDADRDLTALVYSGLVRATPDGSYVPDLASHFDVSEDGRVYTFYIREKATFHDGKPVTANDVLFTIQKAQDPGLKSPERANWDGVAADAPDQKTVRFTLKSAYAPFIENVTMGILPKHLWGGVPNEEFPFSELNTNPTGSGPYKVGSIARSAGGIASSYSLRAFNNYTGGEPFIQTLNLRFYQNEQALTDALNSGAIEAASGLSPANMSAKSGERVVTAPLNRVFGVFFNQNQSEVLRDKDVRNALNTSIDRTALVSSILGGYGTPLTGPLPPSIVDGQLATTVPATDLARAAQQKLIAKGWKLEAGVLTKTITTGKTTKTIALSFTLATANVPELRGAAEFLRTEWTRMGAHVQTQVYEQGDLGQNVIRPRKFDALLFGEVIGRELDLYAFWHSSQRNDPGLNIASYANATADKALAAMRQTADQAERQNLYQTFLTALTQDIPAVFLYAPDFVYTVPNDLQGLNVGFIETPSDRYLSVASWHRETDYVWPVFLRK